MSLPYGIRDIKLTPFTDKAGTILGSPVDLPVARTLSFNEVENFNELRGDDRVVAQKGSGPTVEFDMESGGLSFEAFKVMAGGTITETGAPGSTRRVFSKKSTDERPWFRIEGQAIAEEGDLHTIIYKAKCTGDLSGEFADGEFFLTSASGVGIGDVNDDLYDFVENEQITAITGATAVINSITPPGQAAGEAVTLVGSNFTGATSVTFGGVAGVGLVVHSDDVISVDLPAGAAGSVAVVVTTPAGASVPVNYTRA